MDALDENCFLRKVGDVGGGGGGDEGWGLARHHPELYEPIVVLSTSRAWLWRWAVAVVVAEGPERERERERERESFHLLNLLERRGCKMSKGRQHMEKARAR
jgi:hypothetical protein